MALLASTFAGASGSQYNIYACQIVDARGEVKRVFPGGYCEYLPDGRVISSSPRRLALLLPDGRTKWRKKIFVHHQTHIGADGHSFLLLHSSLHKYRGDEYRFDRVSIFAEEGKELRYFDFYDHRRELIALAPAFAKKYRGQVDHTLSPGKYEFSHANSLYEIPTDALAKKIPAFTKGNVLVNINGLALIVVLDRDLKKILWSMPQSRRADPYPRMHDVQVTDEGQLLVYNNNFTPLSSAIEEIDPLTEQRKLLYRASPPESFYGWIEGSVQKLDNANLLLTEVNPHRPPRIFEVSKDGSIVWSIPATVGGLAGEPMSHLLGCKRRDLTEFLRRNEGL